MPAPDPRLHSPANRPSAPGEQATTFVTRVDDGHYLEAGRNWCRSLSGYAPTPGAASVTGTLYRVFDPAAGILLCFSCHSTRPLSVPESQDIVPHEIGVAVKPAMVPGRPTLATRREFIL